jgi:hypothetical protein
MRRTRGKETGRPYLYLLHCTDAQWLTPMLELKVRPAAYISSHLYLSSGLTKFAISIGRVKSEGKVRGTQSVSDWTCVQHSAVLWVVDN